MARTVATQREASATSVVISTIVADKLNGIKAVDAISLFKKP